MSESKVQDIFENYICVVTNETSIINECEKHITKKNNSDINHYIWKSIFDRNVSYNIKLVYETPTKFHSINNAYVWMTQMNINFRTSVPIFVYTTKQPHDAIRICQHIKQVQGIERLDELGVIASITDEIAASTIYLLREYPPLKTFFRNYPGFPAEVNDIILRKSRIISNQIISISNCLRDHDNLNKDKTNGYPGKLVFCLPNLPGALARIINEISGLDGFKFSIINKNAPSFFNNYSYTFRSEMFDNYKMFIFRGDAFLCDIKESGEKSVNLFYNYMGYGDTKFIDNLNHHMKIPNNNKITANYNAKCPLSQYSSCSNSTSKKSPVYNDSNFATIKILANYDDVSGSFGLALSDFLMAGKELKFNDTINNESIAEIAYHNSSLCFDPYKTICRMYLQFKDSNRDINQDEYAYKIKEMFRMRPIMGIKIKPSKVNSEWIQYAEDLKTYFLSMNIEFEIADYNNVIILYNTRYKMIENFKSFLEENF